MNMTKLTAVGLLLAATAFHTPAQSTLVQTLNVHLTGNDTATDKPFSITTRDWIRYFLGTNVSGAQLQLVTPIGNPPGTTGNLGAFLRIVKGNEILMDVTSPDKFNLYQDTISMKTSGSSVTVQAINRFSIDFGYLHAELQGFSNWHIATRLVNGVDTSSSGSFTSSINGIATVDGFTQYSPVRGSISASSPKPGPY
jgi:hypothetical protein